MGGKGGVRKRGFTLLEVLVVLASVIVILGVATVLLSRALPSRQFEVRVERLRTSLDQAKWRALRTGREEEVVVDMEKREVLLPGGRRVVFPRQFSMRVIHPKGGELTSGKWSLLFSPLGGVPPEVLVITDGKREARLWMDPITGAEVEK
ncbi:MAG: type II secretion system protein [Deltaproteobacteria bacterium]|nr:MAG: type II secretion system protein [Deltaproteobacteria bacterium]